MLHTDSEAGGLIPRERLTRDITAALARSPVVALLGPRQCGKSTLARQLSTLRDSRLAPIGKPWEAVHEGISVKLLAQDDELYVQARSGARQKKENAMRRRKLKALVHGLNRLKRRKKIGRDELIRKVAVLRKEAGRIASFVNVREPAADEPVNRTTFTRTFDRLAWRQAGCEQYF